MDSSHLLRSETVEEMEEVIEGDFDEFEYVRGFPLGRFGVGHIGEIYEKGLPFDITFVDTSPVAAVLAVVAVVTHHKKLSGRHHQGAEIIADR